MSESCATVAKPPVAVVFNGVWSHFAVAASAKYRDLMQLYYVHDLDTQSLQRHRALIVPFQSDHAALGRVSAGLYALLARGGRMAVFGNTGDWIDADWRDRPVDNYWWKTDPGQPPIVDTDFTHPLFRGLSPRHAGWHNHGVFTRLPREARILQRSREGEVVSWCTTAHGGELLCSTMDPIVEHGVQQIQHLDHFVDQLCFWLCGRRPAAARLRIDAADYGRPWPPTRRGAAAGAGCGLEGAARLGSDSPG